MKRLMKKFKNTLRHTALILACSVGLVSCGGDESDSSSDNPDVGFGWVKISSHRAHTYGDADDGGAYAHLEGTAFKSKSYSRFPCGGLCCFFCRYDNAYPGVDVSWSNNTTSFNGTAESEYGNMTHWDHNWSAKIPLSPGSNDIAIRAFDPAGNLGNASVNVTYLPPAPREIVTNSDDNQITLEWKSVWGADSYNIYWSTGPGVTKYNGNMITYVENPFIHSGIINGVIYYYVITSIYAEHESAESIEVSAIPGMPEQPTEVTTTVSDTEIIISWDDVSLATSYHLYWSNETNVTTKSGTQIADISSPYTHTDLVGLPYYYVVAAVNSVGESIASPEVTAIPNLPPPAPTDLKATSLNYQIDIEWNSVPGKNIYTLYRCRARTYYNPTRSGSYCVWGSPWQKVYSETDTLFTDNNVKIDQAFLYHVTAKNDFGESESSEQIGVVNEL